MGKWRFSNLGVLRGIKGEILSALTLCPRYFGLGQPASWAAKLWVVTMKQTLPQGTSHLRRKFVDPGFQWLPGVLSQVQAGGQSDIAESEYPGIDLWDLLRSQRSMRGHMIRPCHTPACAVHMRICAIVLHARVFRALEL